MVRKLWKSKFGFIDPGAIMGVVVALIILAVGVFAFFVTIESISSTVNDTDNERIQEVFGNVTGVGNSIFNIMGFVLIVGAVMAVVGIVYNFVLRTSSDDYYSHSSSSKRITPDRQRSQTYDQHTRRHMEKERQRHTSRHITRREIDKLATPNEIGDYELASVDTLERINVKVDDYKNNGHWVKTKKLDKDSYALYVSKWTRDFTSEYGRPKFR